MGASKQECEFLKDCAVFQKYQLGALKNLAIALYCTGPDLDRCVRRKLRLAGYVVPANLLPSGETTDELGG